jgi:hypothetical protein
MSAPAHADAPISVHAMVHTCCTPKAEKERIFSEAHALGARYVRVDVELNGIFGAPGGEPDWSDLDEVMDLSKKYDLRVLGLLTVPLHYSNADEFGTWSGQAAEHAGGAIDHWEVLNEPDGDWAWDGTPEEYAQMLAAAHDGIKAKAPHDVVLLGGLQKPHEPEWLQRVFDTPGADAIHKFDIANIHLRGPVDAVVRRYDTFKAWLAERGVTGPLWVTEHGYAADPAFQSDPDYRGGDSSQAAYLTQTLVGLGEVGAPQVFVTLHDGGLDGKYATEGLERIDEMPGGDYPATRRESFAAVHRLVDGWDQVMAWRSEQREEEQAQRVEQGKAALWATGARSARDKFNEARLRVHSGQDDLARKHLPERTAARLHRRLDRARALLAGTRAALLWNGVIANWHSQRADEHGAAVAMLKERIAG